MSDFINVTKLFGELFNNSSNIIYGESQRGKSYMENWHRKNQLEFIRRQREEKLKIKKDTK